MLKSEPITFSAAFRMHDDAVRTVGAVNVALNCDTKLFIDPLLLRECSIVTFRNSAVSAYKARFELVIKLLNASKAPGDKAWEAARKQLSFPEMPYTHLGYSSGEYGSGFGTLLTDSLLLSAKQVIDLGVTDPDIFVALALFEEGVGPDRISDMTSHIVLESLIEFTINVASNLGLPTVSFPIKELQGREFMLPANPVDNGKSPIVLVPHDIVRDLPVASDWESVAAAAAETQDLRDRVNADIGNIWEAKTKKEKQQIKARLVSSRTAIEMFLDVVRNAADESYDVEIDHNGELYPSDVRRRIATTNPLDLHQYSGRHLNHEEAEEVVVSIIEQFRRMIEDNGMWSLLWNEKKDKPKHEKVSQQLFFAIACAYCEANNLDVTPEANAGNGPVDFKFSQGSKLRILVEIKKSNNSSLVSGYKNQLNIYKDADNTACAHYVIVDVGGLTPEKRLALTAAHKEAGNAPKGASKIWYIDSLIKRSASKRKGDLFDE